MGRTIPLTKSQDALYTAWMRELRGLMDATIAVFNEALAARMRVMGAESGIDLDGGEWRWDAATKSFRDLTPEAQVPPPDEVPEVETEPEVK